MSLLLKNTTIINSEYKSINNAYLGIDGSTIDYIGQCKPEKKYTAEKDMAGKILIPGLINCHGHAAMTLLRGMGNNLPLNEWLEKSFAIEDTMTQEDFLAGMKLAMLEMLACGTTSFSDMYMFEYYCIQAVEESRMKANLSRGFCGGYNGEQLKDSHRRKESFDMFNNFNGAFDDRLRIDFSIHAEYTTHEHFVKEWAEELKGVEGARMQLHLSETKKEHDECVAKYGKTPAQFFADYGVFDIPSSAAHCVWVTDNDLKILKNKNVGICHCPESNLKLGSGIAPVRKMSDMGFAIGLGTDGAASNNNLNMFEELHTASILHGGLSSEQCLKMATINGAKIQGREDTGVLEVGKKADIVAVSCDGPHMHPNLDSLALLCYSAQASDVCMTMVNGEILYENGEYKTLDKDRIFFDAGQSVKRLYNL